MFPHHPVYANVCHTELIKQPYKSGSLIEPPVLPYNGVLDGASPFAGAPVASSQYSHRFYYCTHITPLSFDLTGFHTCMELFCKVGNPSIPSHAMIISSNRKIRGKSTCQHPIWACRSNILPIRRCRCSSQSASSSFESLPSRIEIDSSRQNIRN